MRKSINLVSGPKRKDNPLRKLYVPSLVIFFSLVTISIGLIGYRLFLGNTYNLLEEEEQRLNSQLLTFVEKRDKIIEIKSRLSEIKKIISSRAPITDRIDTISSLIPPSASVNSINGTDLDMQLAIDSEDLASLNATLEEKIAELVEDKKRSIKRIEMRSFSLNPDTLRYSLSLGIEFN